MPDSATRYEMMLRLRSAANEAGMLRMHLRRAVQRLAKQSLQHERVSMQDMQRLVQQVNQLEDALNETLDKL